MLMGSVFLSGNGNTTKSSKKLKRRPAPSRITPGQSLTKSFTPEVGSRRLYCRTPEKYFGGDFSVE